MDPCHTYDVFDHVGIAVADVDSVTEFFLALGLEVEGRTFMEGEFLDTVCGIPESRTEVVMLRTPNGDARLELANFVRPEHEPDLQPRWPTSWDSATSPSRLMTFRS